MIGTQSNLKNAIWKWGGHPQVLKSPELVALEAELLAIGRAVESPLEVTGICGLSSPFPNISNIVIEIDPKLYIDVEWKKSIIEALATLHYANVQSKKTSAQMIELISAVPQVLQSMLLLSSLLILTVACSTSNPN